jgi:hypothetical protein
LVAHIRIARITSLHSGYKVCASTLRGILRASGRSLVCCSHPVSMLSHLEGFGPSLTLVVAIPLQVVHDKILILDQIIMVIHGSSIHDRIQD